MSSVKRATTKRGLFLAGSVNSLLHSRVQQQLYDIFLRVVVITPSMVNYCVFVDIFSSSISVSEGTGDVLFIWRVESDRKTGKLFARATGNMRT